MNRILTAIVDQPRLLKFVDVVTGAAIQNISLSYDIITGPIVVGDMCTITLQTSDTTRETQVYKMSSGAIVNRFSSTL